MGRKYVWHIAYEYEVPYSKGLDVEGNPNLEWREEADAPEPVVEEAPKAPVKAPVVTSKPPAKPAPKKVTK